MHTVNFNFMQTHDIRTDFKTIIIYRIIIYSEMILGEPNTEIQDVKHSKQLSLHVSKICWSEIVKEAKNAKQKPLDHEYFSARGSTSTVRPDGLRGKVKKESKFVIVINPTLRWSKSLL